tara:strand:- start:723 stop:1217 length:495 start_codon:yes stop_codon:yes gene_type:complete
MNILINHFLFNKKAKNNENLNNGLVNQYGEIAKLVREARAKKNLSVKELSRISKIPEQTLLSIENNNKKKRPKYPFIRSILIKLEECLLLKKDTLVKLSIKKGETLKRENKQFLLKKFDVINTWQGSILYFFVLVLTIFILKRYFVLNVDVIEIQNIENKIIDK